MQQEKKESVELKNHRQSPKKGKVGESNPQTEIHTIGLTPQFGS